MEELPVAEMTFRGHLPRLRFMLNARLHVRVINFRIIIIIIIIITYYHW